MLGLASTECLFIDLNGTCQHLQLWKSRSRNSERFSVTTTLHLAKVFNWRSIEIYDSIIVKCQLLNFIAEFILISRSHMQRLHICLVAVLMTAILHSSSTLTCACSFCKIHVSLLNKVPLHHRAIVSAGLDKIMKIVPISFQLSLSIPLMV